MPTLVTPQASVAIERCLNCEAERQGAYCHACGQRYGQPRLTVTAVIHDSVQRLLSLERGLLRTVYELSLDPGGVVRRYVEGKRKRYVNPVAYLLFGIALMLVCYELYEPQMRAYLETTLATTLDDISRETSAGSQATPADLTPEQRQLFAETMTGLSKRANLTTLAMALPFVALMRLFFRKAGVNFAELTVFAAYCFGQVFLLYAILSTPLILAGADIATVTQWSLLLYFIVPGFAAVGFLGRRVGVVLRTSLAMAITYLLFAAVLWTGGLVYVKLTG